MARVRQSSIAALLALVVLTVILGACGGDDDSGTERGLTLTATGGKVTVVARDLYFNAKEIDAPAGPLAVTLDNKGAVLHDFTIDDPKFKVDATAGKSKTGTVDLTPGNYAYYCNVPGHKASMHGTLVVK